MTNQELVHKLKLYREIIEDKNNDIEKMTLELYTYRLKEWEGMTPEQRKEAICSKTCEHCRMGWHNNGATCHLCDNQADIGKPILKEHKSLKGRIYHTIETTICSRYVED